MRLDEWQKYIETQFLEDKSRSKEGDAPLPADGQITLPLDGIIPTGPAASPGMPKEPKSEDAGDRPAFLAPIGKGAAQEPRHLEIVTAPDGEEQPAAPGDAALGDVADDDAARLETVEAGPGVQLSLTAEEPANADAATLRLDLRMTEAVVSDGRGLRSVTADDGTDPDDAERDEATCDGTDSLPGADKSSDHNLPPRPRIVRPDSDGSPRRTVANDLKTDIPPFILYLPTSRIGELQESANLQTNAPSDGIDVNPREVESDAAEYAKDELRRTPKRRARHARNVRPENVQSGLSAAEHWAKIPKYLQTLLALERMEEQEIAQYSYKRPFEEKRKELIERLLDPILSLEDTARLLNVCPTTVRRYTNKGILTHYRKEPENASSGSANTDKETRQRRFRLSDVLAFLETQAAAIEDDRRADSEAIERAAHRDAADMPEPAEETSDLPETP